MSIRQRPTGTCVCIPTLNFVVYLSSNLFDVQKCDLDEDWFSDNDVDCELETGLFSDIEFKCNVDSECNIVCDDGVLGQIPQAYFAPVEKILAAWKPSD